MIVLAAGLAIAFGVWVIALGPAWMRRTADAGGHWALAGIIYLAGPINVLIQLTYPNGADPQGLGLLLARANTVASWSLGAVALVSALRQPRRGRTALTAALLFFYACLVLSSAFGYQPEPPKEEYFITPLLVVPFVLHGGYRWSWLADVLRKALRAIVIFSLASVLLLPSVAYDQECCREIFGIERVQGVTGHPNTLAILACFLVILELRGGRLLWTLPPLLAMLLAQSTTGWVALTLGLLVLAGRLGSTTRIAAFALALGGLVLAASDPNVVNDFLPPDFWTFTGRTTIWQAALHGFFLSPVFGYGPNLLDDQYRSVYLGSFDAAAQAHNQFVQTLGSTGIVGGASLVALLVAVYATSVRAAGRTGGLSLALALALSARLLSEIPLTPQGSTATLLLVVAVVGIAAAGAPEPPPRGRGAVPVRGPMRRPGATPLVVPTGGAVGVRTRAAR
ncbi:O-antigen ligase family protein [Amnibacterium endophyticum]|uniref:O-antigen ligase family protein n=1 Tax=Amnibacterium endophyticum TaxID=2109337 RepID=A0ABW4L9H5_9MICO